MKLHIYALLIAALSVFGCATKGKTSSAASPAPSPAPVQAPLPATAPPSKAVAAAPAKATATTAAAAAAAQDLACTRGSESRTLKVELTEPKGCKVWYPGTGAADPVAWSTTGVSHCENVSKKIRGNLEAAGFTCAAPAREAAASKPETDKEKVKTN